LWDLCQSLPAHRVLKNHAGGATAYVCVWGGSQEERGRWRMPTLWCGCVDWSPLTPPPSPPILTPSRAPPPPRPPQEISKLQIRVSALEAGLVEAKAGIADNKQWVERLKPCLEWKARIEALEAAAAAVRPPPPPTCEPPPTPSGSPPLLFYSLPIPTCSSHSYSSPSPHSTSLHSLPPPHSLPVGCPCSDAHTNLCHPIFLPFSCHPILLPFSRLCLT
jgi:hypothetical protein